MLELLSLGQIITPPDMRMALCAIGVPKPCGLNWRSQGGIHGATTVTIALT